MEASQPVIGFESAWKPDINGFDIHYPAVATLMKLLDK